MPTASPRQNQQTKNVAGIFRGRHKWYWVIGVLSTLCLVLLIAAPFVLSQMTLKLVAAGMENYLRDKYAQEFKVTNITTNGVGLGMPGQWIGKTHPVNDSSLIFQTGKSRATGSYFDGYSGAVWAREERPRVESFLKTIYGADMPEFDLITHIPTAENPDPIRGKVPSIDDAMKQYGNNFFYDLTVKTTTDHELSQDEIKESAGKIDSLINYVLAKKVSSPSVRYAINISTQNAGYICDLYKNQLMDKNKINDCLTKVNKKAW